MFKRFVTRLLILLQIYGCLFQGVAHGVDLSDYYNIQDEIHLSSFRGEDGGMRLALGTNLDGQSPQMLDIIDIPTFSGLKQKNSEYSVVNAEIDEDEDAKSDISTDDEFEGEGITRTSLATYFTLQGLNFSISNTGAIEISGGQNDRQKRIFLNCDQPIILNGIEAYAIKVNAPKIINRGKSAIDYLMFEGHEDQLEKTLFINDGDLKAKELFLNNINGCNRGSIVAPSFRIDGELASTGVMESNELTLGENAFLRLGEDSRAYIKTLLLSKSSHLENKQRADDVLGIGVLHSLDASIINHGTMAIDEVAENSSFLAITNRHFIGIDQGKNIKAETFINSGAFGIDQVSIKVSNGTNSGVLKANSLEVTKDFLNEKTGAVKTQSVSGDGELANIGVIETDGTLALDVNKCTNSGSVRAQSITGLVKLHNDDGASIEAVETLSFANSLVNDGNIKAKVITLDSDKLTQNGNLTGQVINLGGAKTFTNSGTITASQKLKLDLTNLINEGALQSPLIDISKLNDFTNTKDAVVETNSNLTFSKAKVVNNGRIKAGNYTFNGGSLTQNGQIEGKSFTTTNKAVVRTSDSQEMNLSGELQSDTDWSIRGKINAQKFSRYGDIDLYGTLTLAESFTGRGTIHKGGKLTAKKLDFYSDVIINGEIAAETLECANLLTLNGKSLIKEKATVGGFFKVGADGDLQGFKNSNLSLILNSDAEIAGRVDVDNLVSQAIKLDGQLLSRKQTQIKTSLEISRNARADLSDLKADDLNITNHGSLQLNGQKKATFTLHNHGKAQINGGNAYTDWDNAINVLLKNYSTGRLTINKGTFNLSQSNGMNDTSENAGTFVDNTSWMWFGGFKNTGLWTSPSSRLLFDYSGQDMGNYQVNGDLTVNSLVDGIKVLDGLNQAKAKKVILNAPEIKPNTATTLKKYPWPLEMHIQGDINNNTHIHAPSLYIKSSNLKTTGNLFGTSDTLRLDIENLAEINAQVGGKTSATIHAKHLRVLGKTGIPGAAAPNVLYKRNGNGIYSNGEIELSAEELIENTYGIVQGSNYKITAPKLINLAGLIVGTNHKLKNIIDVKEPKNLRDAQGSYRTKGHSYESGGKDWCWCHGDRYHKCCNGGLSRDPIYYETSDEGVIFAQGDLLFIYNYLEMLASRISCGGELTFKAENRNLIFTDTSTALPGITKMDKRNNHSCHIVARRNINAEFGSGDISSSFNGENIFVTAANLTLQNLGISPNQLAQLLNLSSETQRSLPFDNKAVVPTTLVMLGANKESTDLSYQDNLNILQQTMGTSFYTLYRGIKCLGLNADELFKTMFDSVADHVRGDKNTTSTQRSIKFGDTEHKIEVLANPTLTPQDLLNSGVLGVFFEFAHNIHSLESEQKANKDIKATMVLPFEKTDGVNTQGDVNIHTTEGDLNVENNVSGQNVELVSENAAVTLASTTERKHNWQDYHDTFIKTTVTAVENLLIQGKTDAIIKAADTKSGKKTDIIAETGMVLDKAVAKVDHTEVTTSDKRSHTTTKTTHIEQKVSTHQSDGVVNIKAATGVLQEGTKNTNTKIDAPIIIQNEVHDQHHVENHTVVHKSKGGFFGSIGSFFGVKEKKNIHQNSNSATSKGCQNSGDTFIAMAEKLFKATNPNFTARKSEINAGEKIEIKAGTNTNQNQMQSTYQGAVWNKTKSKTESHITHQNPAFENNVYLFSPKVILEKVRGSLDTFNNITNKAELLKNNQLQIDEVEDQHHASEKSQKSLSTGAAMLTKLAVGIAMMYAAPVSGMMGLSGTTAVMANAGFATLCSDATVCLVEKDGDPAKAIQALSKSKIATNIARSMLTAGLVSEISDVVGIPSTNLELIDYAKKAAISSAVNTVLAVSIDHQSFEKAMLQGMTTAALSTATSYLANQIGGAYFGKQIDPVSHKLLHGLLGGVSGGLTSKLMGKSFENGVVSGALGAVIAETMTEMLKPDLAQEMAKSKSNGLSPEEFREQFMEKAQRSAKWADFTGALTAFATGQDVEIAHQTGNNATENNFLPGIWLAVTAAGTAYEGYQIYQTYQNEGAEAAIKHLGITVASAVVLGGAVAVGFKVGKKFYPTLKEAYTAALQNSPMLKASLKAFEGKVGKIEDAIQIKFTGLSKGNHRGAETLKTFEKQTIKETGGKVKDYEVGSYKDLIKRPKEITNGQKLEIHHAPQQHPANQVIKNYNPKEAPSIALPVREHRKIPNVKGEYIKNPRDLMAQDVQNLRQHTMAPNNKIQELIDLTKNRYPESFKK